MPAFAFLLTVAKDKPRIEGNCDEWGTKEYNVALGRRRSVSVKNRRDEFIVVSP